MANDLLVKFAEELKSIREEQGFTHSSLYEKIRVEIKYINAIEEANFGIIGDVYMKGFLRSYLKALNLDDAYYLNRYVMAKQGKDVKEIVSEKKEDVEKPEIEETDKEVEVVSITQTNKQKKTVSINVSAESSAEQMKRDFNIVIYIFLTIVVGLIIAIVVIVRGSKTEIVVEKSFEDVAKEQEERYDLKKELIDSSFAYSNGKLNIKLKANETCWLKVKIDSDEPFEILLRKGKDTLIVADKIMELNIGNSNGLELFINNIKTEIPGGKNKVKNIRIDPSGINEMAKKSGYKNDTTKN